MSHPLDGKLEPEAAGVDWQFAMHASIAISLKRIADAITLTDLPHAAGAVLEQLDGGHFVSSGAREALRRALGQ
jgi:hypothetical protein